MGDDVHLDIEGVRVETPTNTPIVLLRERDGSRYLPIWIGAAEATAIAYAQQGVVPPRPLTHDLLRSVILELGHTLTRVRITALEEGVYYAALDIDGGAESGGYTVESRSSDAIALALRMNAPVLAPRLLLEEAGIRIEDDGEAEGEGEAPEDELERFKEFLDHVSPEDFELGEQP